MGVFRLEQWLGIGLGPTVLIVVRIAVGGTIFNRFVQNKVWPTTEVDPQEKYVIRLHAALIAVAVIIGFTFAFFPSESFIDDSVETPYYIVPKTTISQAISETQTSESGEPAGSGA
jgi:hypothetical protein